MPRTGHYILTGEVNSGKSTFLLEKLGVWAGKGFKASGWISSPFFKGNVKSGYDLYLIIDSKVSEKKRFMRDFEFEKATKWKRFYLDENIFRAVSDVDFGHPDIFLIDEVGPLELEAKKGFFPILDGLYSRYPLTVTTVRSSCLETFKQFFPRHRVLENLDL